MLDTPFQRTLKSMRPLNAVEKVVASGHRVHVITARKGDTYANLAKNLQVLDYAESRLRLLNGHYPSGEFSAGQLVKVLRH